MKPTYRKRCKLQGKPQGKPIVTIHAAPPVLRALVASVESRWNVTLAHKESRHA